MDLFTLDEGLIRNEIFDDYESLIWTERFNEWGDFELTLFSSPRASRILVKDTMLEIAESHRIMVIETTESGLNDDGKLIYIVKGRSLESWLLKRPALHPTNSKWEWNAVPTSIIEGMFNSICRDGEISSNDIIPYLHSGNLFPTDTIDPPVDPIIVEVSPTNLYEPIAEIAKSYNLGFRLVKDPNEPKLYFNVYTGSDRSSSQGTYDAVIFTQTLDTLKNIKNFNSGTDERNVAIVVSPVGREIVYAAGVDPSSAGFERKVLVVNADDIEDTNPIIATTRMVQRGYEELNKHREVSVFDGEARQDGPYKYGVDYNLGDIVEMRDPSGVGNRMRVTEQIFASDAEGIRSYPSLEKDVYVSAGSWLSWGAHITWAEAGETDYWANV